MPTKARRILWFGNAVSLLILLVGCWCATVAPAAWMRGAAALSMATIMVVEFLWMWARWRRAEVELLRSEAAQRWRRKAGDSAPKVSFLVAEDLQMGEAVVVTNSGYVQRPERFAGWNRRPVPLPPPAKAHWMTGFLGDEDLEGDHDVQ